VTGDNTRNLKNEVLCVDMQLCVIIELWWSKLCVLDNTLQKLVGPIFASSTVCRRSVRSTGSEGP